MSAARTVGATFTPWFTVVLGTPTKGKVSITARWAIPTSHPLPLTYLEILQGTGTLATKATLAYSGSLSTTGIAGTAGSVRFHLTATRGGTSVSPSVVPY
jgi:hypothetical protein